MNDIMAAGAYKAAYECHLRIPQDISIVGFDNREIARYLQPPLTTMNLPLKEIGEQSTEILIDSIENKHSRTNQLVIPCQIIQRESVSNKLNLR
jgi:LacI family transcriptional regulator